MKRRPIREYIIQDVGKSKRPKIEVRATKPSRRRGSPKNQAQSATPVLREPNTIQTSSEPPTLDAETMAEILPDDTAQMPQKNSAKRTKVPILLCASKQHLSISLDPIRLHSRLVPHAGSVFKCCL